MLWWIFLRHGCNVYTCHYVGVWIPHSAPLRTVSLRCANGWRQRSTRMYVQYIGNSEAKDLFPFLRSVCRRPGFSVAGIFTVFMVDNLPDYSVYVIYWTVPTKLLQLQWSVHRNWCLLLGILYVYAISSYCMSQAIYSYELGHLQLWATPSPAMSQAISSYEPGHLQLWATPSPAMSYAMSRYEPSHLQLSAITYPAMRHAISSYEPRHLQLWATPSPAMSHAISSFEPRHLQLWATPSPALSHTISSY